MSVRLGIFATVLAGAAILWLTHYCVAASGVFVVSVLLLLEAAMFNYLTYSRINIRVGRAKDAKLLDGSPDTLGHHILCVPVHLRVRFWEVRNIRIVLRSGNIQIDSAMFDGRGRSTLEDTFALDWFSPKLFACIGFLEGGFLRLGTPLLRENLQGRSSCPVKLEIWKDTKCVASACYTLALHGGKMYLSDSKCEADGHA